MMWVSPRETVLLFIPAARKLRDKPVWARALFFVLFMVINYMLIALVFLFALEGIHLVYPASDASLPSWVPPAFVGAWMAGGYLVWSILFGKRKEKLPEKLHFEK